MAGGIVLQNILNRVLRCRHRRRSLPITPRGEKQCYAVCLDCGQRILYDPQAPKTSAAAQAQTGGPEIPQNHRPHRIAGWHDAEPLGRLKHACDSGSAQRRILARGLGIAIGECVLAVNGPFFFGRFGLNVPEAAALGCVLGAAGGSGFADFVWRIRSRKQALAPMPLERGTLSGSQFGDWLEAEEQILRAHQDALVDEASSESFPASDPPAYSGVGLAPEFQRVQAKKEGK